MGDWQKPLIGLVAGTALAMTAGASELDSTSWQLVQIQSMDDSIHLPEDPEKYTLTLQADGTASMQADCNRATGSWTSEAAGRLEFSKLAATNALCPPESISGKYLAQFRWVRSYVLEDGHLFLATMADGSIIEFVPADTTPAVASVLGEEIRSADADEVKSTILTVLLDQYAAERGIAAEPAEVDAFVEEMRRGMAERGLDSESELTPAEAAEAEAMRRQMGEALILQWKINKALYEQYGGRIIYQQLGPEPLDAYRRFLEEEQADGAFVIRDPGIRKDFWRYFTDDSIHSFMEPGSADEKRAFTTPPWEGRR